MSYDRDEVLARVDLAELADQLLAPRHPRTRSWPCPNPQHKQTGRTPPVTIFDDRRGGQRWHCHGCGEGGTAIDLTIRSGVATDFREALQWLAGRTHQQPMPANRPHRAARPAHRPAGRTDAATRHKLTVYVDGCAAYLRSSGGADVRRWLMETRGIPWVVIEHAGLGADPGEARLRRPIGVPRVTPAAVFPIGVGDDVVFTQSRLLRPRDGMPRWMSTAASVAPNPKIALFSPPRSDSGGPVVITEGVLDALSAVSGGCRAAAILGTGVINDGVVEQLLRSRGDLVLAMDNDAAGRLASGRLATRLRDQGVPVAALDIPERFSDLNDWHVASGEAWSAVLRRSCRLGSGPLGSRHRPAPSRGGSPGHSQASL